MRRSILSFNRLHIRRGLILALLLVICQKAEARTCVAVPVCEETKVYVTKTKAMTWAEYAAWKNSHQITWFQKHYETLTNVVIEWEEDGKLMIACIDEYGICTK